MKAFSFSPVQLGVQRLLKIQEPSYGIDLLGSPVFAPEEQNVYRAQS